MSVDLQNPMRTEPETGSRRTIAREDTAGAIAAMGRRRKANDQDARLWITEARHGPRPILLAGKARRRMRGRLRAPCDEPRTEAAADDLRLNRVEAAHFLRRVVGLANCAGGCSAQDL